MKFWMITGETKSIIVKSRTKAEAKVVGRSRFRRGEATIKQISDDDAGEFIETGAELVML